VQELRTVDQRGQGGKAKIANHRQGTVDLHLIRRETHFPGRLQDRNLFRVEAKDPANNPIELEGILTRQQNVHLPRNAAHPRPRTLHGQNAVEQIDCRPQTQADPGDEPGKHLPVRTGPHMPLRLPVPDDAAEQVLDRQGKQHLAVGLEFGQVHDDVRPDCVLGHFDLAERFADVDADRIPKRTALAVETAQGLTDPAHLQNQIESAGRRTVGHQRTATPFVAVFHDGPDHGRMGQNGPARRGRGEKIRLDQNTLSRPEVAPPRGIHHLENEGAKGFTLIGRVADNDNGHHPFLLRPKLS